MADIAQAAGMLPEDTVLKAASKLFVHLWEEAWSQAPGTIEGDADALHDMRVAVRRLRSALQTFEGEEVPLPPHIKKEFKRWRKKLGRVGDALGAVRDHDVLNDYLQKYAKTKLKQPVAESGGLAAFERYLQAERTDCFGPMVKRLHRAQEPQSTREEFARWALGLPAAQLDGGELTLIRDAAPIMLHARIEDALLEAATLDNPADDEGHHELRKSLRRVRYTLETLGVAFNGPVKPAVKRLTDLQDVLGEMQDRAVLQDTAQKAFAPKKGEHAKAGHKHASHDTESSPSTLPSDMDAFLQFGEERRHSGLGRARTAWKKLQSDEFFEKLKSI